MRRYMRFSAPLKPAKSNFKLPPHIILGLSVENVTSFVNCGHLTARGGGANKNAVFSASPIKFKFNALTVCLGYGIITL